MQGKPCYKEMKRGERELATSKSRIREYGFVGKDLVVVNKLSARWVTIVTIPTVATVLMSIQRPGIQIACLGLSFSETWAIGKVSCWGLSLSVRLVLAKAGGVLTSGWSSCGIAWLVMGQLHNETLNERLAYPEIDSVR